MRLDKLTIKAQEVVSKAMDTASEAGHAEITALHLLQALAGQEQGAVPAVLQRLGVAADQVLSQVQPRIDALPRTIGAATSPVLSMSSKKVLII